MEEELCSHDKNETWSLVKLLTKKKTLKKKYVFWVKDEVYRSKRYQVRLLVKGLQHKEGFDYNNIFFPFVKMTTIIIILGIVASEDLHVKEIDGKTFILHGDLGEDIYMAEL